MKNFVLLISFLIMAIACKTDKKPLVETSKTPETALKKNHTFYLGTYTKEESEGIYRYMLHSDGTMEKLGLVARTENPSFLTLTKDRKFLITVNETDATDGSGSVASYAVKGDSLSFVTRSSSGGANPCFITVNDKGMVLTTNYSSGSVGLLKIDDTGRLSDLLFTQQHSGKGTTERQKGPHAHSVYFLPDSDNEIVSVDLGTNQLWFSQITDDKDELILSESPILNLLSGSGPRHLTFHPNGKWIYVLNELNSTISQISKTNEGFSVTKSFPTLPKDFKGDNYPADIHMTRDGKFLYASNRGHNSIAIFEINSENGSLKILGHESVQGEWPRNFSFSPEEDFLLVANQRSNNITCFKRNTKTGLLAYVSKVDAPSPVCILF